MGMLHHARHIVLLESARTELLRSTGESYREWEDSHGLYLPVMAVDIRYERPARYDDLLQITVRLVAMTRLRLVFTYQITCPQRGELNASARTEHVFMSREGRAIRAPKETLERLQSWLSAEAADGFPS
jgi:acyl-CoA thioester hydrolase